MEPAAFTCITKVPYTGSSDLPCSTLPVLGLQIFRLGQETASVSNQYKAFIQMHLSYPKNSPLLRQITHGGFLKHPLVFLGVCQLLYKC